MTEKVDKSLKEVWEWKEACYQEIKNMTSEERINHITREADRILEEYGMETVECEDGYRRIQKKQRSIVSEKKEEYYVEKNL